MVIRKRFMTKKDEEELRKESLFTQTTLLLLQKNEELLIAWNEAHKKEDEVCAKTAAETNSETKMVKLAVKNELEPG